MVPIGEHVSQAKSLRSSRLLPYNALGSMRKEDRIGFRVPAELKRALVQIAKNEGRSLAQVCEILLRGGVSLYREEGPKYLQRLVSRQKKEPSE